MQEGSSASDLHSESETEASPARVHKSRPHHRTEIFVTVEPRQDKRRRDACAPTEALGDKPKQRRDSICSKQSLRSVVCFLSRGNEIDPCVFLVVRRPARGYLFLRTLVTLKGCVLGRVSTATSALLARSCFRSVDGFSFVDVWWEGDASRSFPCAMNNHP